MRLPNAPLIAVLYKLLIGFLMCLFLQEYLEIYSLFCTIELDTWSAQHHLINLFRSYCCVPQL